VRGGKGGKSSMGGVETMRRCPHPPGGSKLRSALNPYTLSGTAKREEYRKKKKRGRAEKLPTAEKKRRRPRVVSQTMLSPRNRKVGEKKRVLIMGPSGKGGKPRRKPRFKFLRRWPSQKKAETRNSISVTKNPVGTAAFSKKGG